jgi:hypothetical protein
MEIFMLICRKIYDTLSDTTDTSVTVDVDALDFNVECGEVPSQNYTIDIGSVSGGVSLAVSVNTGGLAVGLCLSALSFSTRNCIVVLQVYRAMLLSTPMWHRVRTSCENSIYRYRQLKPLAAFFYKFLEEADPLTANSSRNLYVLAVTAFETLLPQDSNNSTGTVFSKVIGPFTVYAKVIICSLTVSDSTATIDGLNRPVNDSGELPETKNHSWAIQQPLASRGYQYEDIFSSLYGTPAILPPSEQDVDLGLKLTLLETVFSGIFLNADLFENVNQTLYELETNFMQTTSISYACVGQYLGYQNVPQYARSSSVAAESFTYSM